MYSLYDCHREENTIFSDRRLLVDVGQYKQSSLPYSVIYKLTEQ